MLNIYALLGQRIKEERKARHLTQQELADIVGMDTGHLSRVEHGKTVPSINAIVKIADAFNLPVSKLFDNIPARKATDYGWSEKVGIMVKDASPQKRERILRTLKTLIKEY